MIIFYIVALLVAAFFGVLLLTEGPDMLRDWRRSFGRLDSGSADVARLREEMDRLAARVEQLDEEQRFLVRLLSDDERNRLRDRPDAATLPPSPPEPQGS